MISKSRLSDYVLKDCYPSFVYEVRTCDGDVILFDSPNEASNFAGEGVDFKAIPLYTAAKLKPEPDKVESTPYSTITLPEVNPSYVKSQYVTRPEVGYVKSVIAPIG